MLRSRRSFAWSLILALMCASFVVAQGPLVVHAATQTIIVTTALDQFNDSTLPDYKCDLTTTDGCSLREALKLANDGAAGMTTNIVFNIPPNTSGYSQDTYAGQVIETWTISLESPLPPIDHDNTIIDGFSQEEFVSGVQNGFGPTIIVDGFDLSNGTAFSPPQQTGGLTLRASNCTVKGLGIINFQTNAGLVGIGLEIRTRTGNAATNNKIQGNYIGIDKVGIVPAPNNRGIWVRTANNQIGGSNSQFSDEPNIISGNRDDGILVEGDGNKIQGNYIGLDRTGQNDVGNNQAGIAVRIADNNLIGAPSTAINSVFGNIISGNDQHGVYIYNGSNNTINGNLIGTTTNGSKGLPNSRDGVRIESAGLPTSNNKVGERNYFTRNTISGNGQAGLRITGTSASDNVVLNNFIGPSSGGIGLSSPSNQTGIIVENGSDRNTIGGPLLGDFTILAPNNDSNLISGNLKDGIVISGTVALDNKIFGNTIGLTYSRISLFGNGRYGISVMNGARNVTIGGTGTSGNVISSNGAAGISIVGSTASVTDVLILGNIIGLARNTTSPITAASPINSAAGNNGDGVFIDHADRVHIGGTAAQANIIAKNQGNGITTNRTNYTIIQNNFIGTLKSGTAFLSLGNFGTGIRATGTVTATGNFVLRNGQHGVWLTNGAKSSLTSNTVSFNDKHGFLVDADASIVGGSATDIRITGSTIYSNTLNGVFLQDGALSPQKVKIFDNSMTGNALNKGNKGIVLNNSTIWPAAGNGGTSNHDIDPPYRLHIDQTGKLSGRVRLKADNPAIEACAQPCTIQVFLTNPQTLDTQGRDKVNVTPTITPDSVDPSFGNFSLAIGLVPPQLALTATDKDGNTSEFAVFTRTFGLDIQPPRFTNPVFPGDVITYTHRITNTGSVDFTNIQLTAFSKLGWPFVLAPANPISLESGQSKPVTITLTLPTGADPRVRFPNIEFTRVTVSATTSLVSPAVVTTASVTDTSVLGAKFILDATFKEGRSGSAAQGTAIDYTRMVMNTGNVTGTVTLNAITDLGWTTLITPTIITLPPGASAGVVSSVAVPKGTQAGTIAQTRLTFNGTPDAQNLVITDTTTTLLTPKATMVAPQLRDGGAGETVLFCHTVTNLSNGAATFALTGVSSLGSKITFISDTPGQQLLNGTTFTIDSTPGSNIFNFCASVVVDIRALPGQTDLVSIGMIDITGAVVGGASVRDQIRIVRSAMAPRLHLPLILR